MIVGRVVVRPHSAWQVEEETYLTVCFVESACEHIIHSNRIWRFVDSTSLGLRIQACLPEHRNLLLSTEGFGLHSDESTTTSTTSSFKFALTSVFSSAAALDTKSSWTYLETELLLCFVTFSRPALWNWTVYLKLIYSLSYTTQSQNRDSFSLLCVCLFA